MEYLLLNNTYIHGYYIALKLVAESPIKLTQDKWEVDLLFVTWK